VLVAQLDPRAGEPRREDVATQLVGLEVEGAGDVERSPDLDVVRQRSILRPQNLDTALVRLER
jgi:hypothetical protein